jgi:hypothetical protein
VLLDSRLAHPDMLQESGMGYVELFKPTSGLLAAAEVLSEVCLLALFFYSWLAGALTVLVVVPWFGTSAQRSTQQRVFFFVFCSKRP